MSLTPDTWHNLRQLAGKLGEPGIGPGGATDEELQTLGVALETLLRTEDWKAVVRLRATFTDLFARDTAGGWPLLMRLDEEAILAARRIDDKAELAHLLGAKGHNLHRQGYHETAIAHFQESTEIFETLNEPFQALKNYYMTALCYRALGHIESAWEILQDVLHAVSQDNPWRGNPLQVAGWMTRDEGDLKRAEQFYRGAISLQSRTQDPDILVAGTLADLGEVLGMQGRYEEAEDCFEQSRFVLNRHEAQYERQEARTLWKYAEMLHLQGKGDKALQLLREADDKVRTHGHYYDMMWRIELSRARIYWQKKRFKEAFQKLRIAFSYRRKLHLSNWLLFKQMLGQRYGSVR